MRLPGHCSAIPTEEQALLPATASRVENATSEGLNRHFTAEIEESLCHHAEHP